MDEHGIWDRTTIYEHRNSPRRRGAWNTLTALGVRA